MSAYITKSEVEQYLGITIHATYVTFVETIISMAQEYIEIYCGGGQLSKRVFNDSDASATRYYNGNGLTKLKIDDLRTITELVVDDVSLVEDDDYFLYPLNAITDGFPYELIELIQPETRIGTGMTSRIDVTAPYIFENIQKNVAITGTWGFSTTPPKMIKVAALRLVGEVIKENIGDNDLKAITKENLGDYSVSYEDMKDTASTEDINKMISHYVRRNNNKKSGVFIAR